MNYKNKFHHFGFQKMNYKNKFHQFDFQKMIYKNIFHLSNRSGEGVCGRGGADIKGPGALPMSAHAWRTQEPDRG